MTRFWGNTEKWAWGPKYFLNAPWFWAVNFDRKVGSPSLESSKKSFRKPNGHLYYCCGHARCKFTWMEVYLCWDYLCTYQHSTSEAELNALHNEVQSITNAFSQHASHSTALVPIFMSSQHSPQSLVLQYFETIDCFIFHNYAFMIDNLFLTNDDFLPDLCFSGELKKKVYFFSSWIIVLFVLIASEFIVHMWQLE